MAEGENRLPKDPLHSTRAIHTHEIKMSKKKKKTQERLGIIEVLIGAGWANSGSFTGGSEF